MQSVHPSGLPNFSEVLNSAGASAPGTLPPGHPAVNPQGANSQQSVPDQSSAKKPR
jgi:hypothetical protein